MIKFSGFSKPASRVKGLVQTCYSYFDSCTSLTGRSHAQTKAKVQSHPGENAYAIGYYTSEFRFKIPVSDLKITLYEKNKNFDEKMVVIRSISGIPKTNIVQKCKSYLQNLTDMDTVKIFPNPVPAGSSMQVAFDVKKAGESYLVMMLNMTGKIVLTKKLYVSDRKQTNAILFPFKNPGNYAVQVVNLSTNRSFTSKVIIL